MSQQVGPLSLSERERDRIHMIDRLVASGEGAVPQLTELLADPSWAVRRAVVAGLAALGAPAVQPLCRLLETRRDDEARVAAVVDALVASSAPVEDSVLALTDHPDAAVAADAAQVLGRRRSPRVVETLVKLVRHPDDNVAVAAIEGLARVGGRAAVDALIAAVQTRNFFRTFPAIDVLGRSGDPRAVQPLVELLNAPEFALEACRALGRSGERAAVPALVALLSSPVDASVRVATLSLADLHDRHRERYGSTGVLDDAIRRAASGPVVARRLAHALTDADAAEQVAACRLLGILGTEVAIPILTRLLDVAGVGPHAAEALARIGRQAADHQVLRSLREGDSARRRTLLPTIASPLGADDVAACLGDPDAAVRAMACDALARIGAARHVPAIFGLLGDANPRVAQAAIAAVQGIGSAETQRLALAAAGSPDARVRRAALRILAYFGYAAALPVFERALRDPDDRVRDAAIQGLPFLDDPRAIERLLEVARDSDQAARATAMRALGQCAADDRVTAFLLRGLADRAPWVRYYACQSLGRLAYAEAAEAIARLLQDEAVQVRVAAVEALSHLDGPLPLDALQAQARSDEPDVRRAALIGLGISRRPESIPILLEAAASTDAPTRLVALSALAEFDSPRVLTALARAVCDADEHVRNAAIGFLAAVPGAEATRLLIELLPEEEETRERILGALATPTDERVAGVASMLGGAGDELSSWLTSVLARLNTHESFTALLDALRSPNVAARKAAATTLGALGSEPATAALRQVAREDPAPEVRRICELVLAQ